MAGQKQIKIYLTRTGLLMEAITRFEGFLSLMGWYDSESVFVLATVIPISTFGGSSERIIRVEN
jgi:hypothetical protein